MSIKTPPHLIYLYGIAFESLCTLHPRNPIPKAKAIRIKDYEVTIEICQDDVMRQLKVRSFW